MATLDEIISSYREPISEESLANLKQAREEESKRLEKLAEKTVPKMPESDLFGQALLAFLPTLAGYGLGKAMGGVGVAETGAAGGAAAGSQAVEQIQKQKMAQSEREAEAAKYMLQRESGLSEKYLEGLSRARLGEERVQAQKLREATRLQLAEDKKTEKAGKPKEFKQDQWRAARYAADMENAERVLEQAEKSGVTGAESGLGRFAKFAPGELLPAEFQKIRAAQESFVNAVLRPETGAAISADEMRRQIRTLFPQPGDSPSVIAEKKKMRQIKMASTIAEAGGAYAAQKQISPAYVEPSKQENVQAQKAQKAQQLRMEIEQLKKQMQQGK
jgi:hypothetical protein